MFLKIYRKDIRIISSNGSLDICSYYDMSGLVVLTFGSEQFECIYACTWLMNVFKGILVVLFNFDQDAKCNMKQITLFYGSWVVFAYQVTFLKYIEQVIIGVVW